MRARVLVRTQFATCVGPPIYLSGPPRKRLDHSAGPWQPWWPWRDIYGSIWAILKGRIKTFWRMLPFLLLASSAMLWIRLSRDFRNQLSKQLHSRNYSPAIFISPGLLSGSSPKHLNPAPHTMPHKNRVRLIVLPHLKTGDMVSALNCSLQSLKRIWGPLLTLRRLRERGPDAQGLRPLRTSPLHTSFYGDLLPSMSSGDWSANPATSCASGRSGLRLAHISRSTRKRSGLGLPAPSEEGFRAVSSDASCRFTISGRRSVRTNTYKSKNQSREAGTSSIIFESMGNSDKYI